MTEPLAGRAVLVTGGNGGIGLAMAAAVGRAGAQVVIWGRDEHKNAAAVERLESDGIVANAFVCDVVDAGSVERAFGASVDAAGGRIDSVFANAGAVSAGRRFVDLTLDEWRATTAVNLDGAFLTLQAGARHMIEHGGGSLVAVSSIAAIHGAPNNESYSASKAGVLGLVRALAVALARHRVRVNALLPGWTRTELATDVLANTAMNEAIVRRTPVRRWADASEMGPAAVFLADPTLTFHTGTDLVVDGGYTVA